MMKNERAALAFLTKILLKELPNAKDGITKGRWRIEAIGQSDSIRAFNVINISWQQIHFEDESSRLEFWNDEVFEGKNRTVLRNDERPYNKIRITAIYTNEIKVEDDDARYDIEMKSHDDVEIYSHLSRRRFKFKVTY